MHFKKYKPEFKGNRLKLLFKLLPLEEDKELHLVTVGN